MTDSQTQENQLVNFYTSEEFAELNKNNDKFNVFNILKLQNAEIRHSNFLGWLLSPDENHYTGDYFLSELLLAALKNIDKTSIAKNFDITDFMNGNLVGASVTLEKLTNEGRRMDIFIDSPSEQLVCVIENKIWSDEGYNQLEDYYKYVTEHNIYKNYKYKIFIFLTPDDNYEHSKLHKNYIRMDYSQICDIINKLLKMKQNTLKMSGAKLLIENYKEMLERSVLHKMDKSISKLCRLIIKNNKSAIDLINEYTTKYKEEVFDILEEVINECGYFENIQAKKEDNHISADIKGISNNNKFKFGHNEEESIVKIHFWNLRWNKSLYFEIGVDEAKSEFQKKREDLIKYIEEKMQNEKIRFNVKKVWAHSSPKISLYTEEEFFNNNSDEKEIKNIILNRLEDNKDIFEKIRVALNSWNP